MGSLPVLFLLVWEAAQYTPACRQWRAKVDLASTVRGKLPAWDDYRRGDMTADEYYGRVRDHRAYAMRDTRPLLCE